MLQRPSPEIPETALIVQGFVSTLAGFAPGYGWGTHRWETVRQGIHHPAVYWGVETYPGSCCGSALSGDVDTGSGARFPRQVRPALPGLVWVRKERGSVSQPGALPAHGPPPTLSWTVVYVEMPKNIPGKLGLKPAERSLAEPE